MPLAIAAVLGVENNKGQLVAARDRGEGNFVEIVENGVYELRNTPSFSLHEAPMAYFKLYVDAKQRGYFAQEDVPTLEKLCVLNTLYDKAMNEYLERSIMQIDEVLGVEVIDPYMKVITTLGDAVARYVKLLGLTPLDRGRPVVDKNGRPLMNGQAAPTENEIQHNAVQNKYWGKPSGTISGVN